MSAFRSAATETIRVRLRRGGSWRSFRLRSAKPFTKGSGRLELAEAIADPKNPLTARVIVNRMWQHHFGRGIVATPSNFGQIGERPTHPELLDYLASSSSSNGWSIKWLHREIMLSAIVCAERAGDAAELSEGSPRIVFLWRANRQRLDVEALRDSMLYRVGQSGLVLRRKGKAARLTTIRISARLWICQPAQDGRHAGAVRLPESR